MRSFLTKGAFALLACSAATWAVPANLKENYQSIIERNPFGLKPIPVVTNNAAAVPAEPPKPKTEIFLTGITSIGYPRLPKKVFLQTREQGKKEPTYYDLQEGVTKDGITVLNIDDKNRKVKITSDGTEMLLSFATHGIQPPAAPVGAPGRPGVPVPGAHPGSAQPLPGAAPNVQPATAHGGGYPTGTPTPMDNGAATYSGGGRQIPTRNVRVRTPGGGDMNFNNPGGGMNDGQQQGANDNAVDPATQYLQMLAEKRAREQQGVPMPPVPPIPNN